MAFQEFEPYSYVGTDGTPKGLAIDLMGQLARSAGYDVSFVFAGNSADSIAMVRDGTADVSALLALTPERLEVGIPTAELGAFEMRAFVMRDHSATVPADLAHLNVGVVRGSHTVTAARAIPFVNLVEFVDRDSMVVALLTRDVDAIVSSSDSLMRRLRQADIEQYTRAIDPPLSSSPYGFIVASTRPDLQMALNTAIADTLTRDDLDVLHGIWFGRSKTLLDYALFWWLAGTLALGLGVFGYTVYHARLQKLNSAQLLRKNAANGLLISALDEMTAAVAIYDLDFKAVHWNRGFETAFPGMVLRLRAGTTMTEILTHTLGGTPQHQHASAGQSDISQGKIMQDIMAGRSNTRTIQTAEGRVFEARDFMLGSQHYASVCVDITRLHDQQDIIRAQTARLEIANDQLKTFSAIAAHDLTAPLQQQKTLMTFITQDLDEAKLTLPAHIQENFSLVEGLSQRMSALINDLLAYARADNDAADGTVSHPTERLKEIVKLFPIKDGFEVKIPKHMPELRIEPTIFDSIMRNLITNAIKHHDKPQGTIQVTAKATQNAVEISVIDDGPGIPARFHESIFRPFQRLSSGVAGSGLGLSYVQKTLRKVGGTIRVADASPRGSAFVITLPARRANDTPFAHAV